MTNTFTNTIMANLRQLSAAANKILNVNIVRNCAVLQMKNGQNRFNPEVISCVHEALDAIEESDASALVTTGTGKFFSNGLDLEWLKQDQRNEKDFVKLMNEFGRLNGRFLTFPMPTAAAINGHAYAGGGVLALAHDYRVMREDRGWTCLNEIRLHLRYPHGMFRMIRERIPSQKTAFDYILGAKRYTGPEAFAEGLVHRLAREENVVNECIDMVTEIVGDEPFDKATMKTLKMDLYRDAYEEATKEYTLDDLLTYHSRSAAVFYGKI